jgi:hypothetical protein
MVASKRIVCPLPSAQHTNRSVSITCDISLDLQKSDVSTNAVPAFRPSVVGARFTERRQCIPVLNHTGCRQRIVSPSTPLLPRNAER